MNKETRTTILDHGYAELIETWGSDEGIVEAARMSTGKGFKGWGSDKPQTCMYCGAVEPLLDSPNRSRETDCLTEDGTTIRGPHQYTAQAGDEKLLRYLYTNKHSTPFEMAGLTIEVKAPIFVYRQWHRHRTQSYNEMSARYTPLPDENYVPTVERLMANATANKQAGTAKGAEDLTGTDALKFQRELIDCYQQAEDVYQVSLMNGVPKELARLMLPVARYSRMRASANLRNWLGFLTLRMDPHAQWEIRQYANAIGEMIAEKFPRTWELFAEGRS